jgi:hypothetical protein
MNYVTTIGTIHGKECRKRGETEEKQGMKENGRRAGGKEGMVDKRSHNQLTTHATLRNQPVHAHLQMTWSLGQHRTFLIPTISESSLDIPATFLFPYLKHII